MYVGLYPNRESIPGDVNDNGEVNISDVTILINLVMSGTSTGSSNTDVNADGSVNITDVTTLINYLLSGHW